MKMYVTIQFDREINQAIHHISPGGYEVEADGKSYAFDFMDYDGFVDTDDRTILHCRMKDEDMDSFPEVNELKKHLSGITKIGELFVYTGETKEGDSDEINPVKLLSLSFAGNDGNDYEISEDILKTAIITNNR